MSQALYDFLGHRFKPSNPSWIFNPLKSYIGERVVTSIGVLTQCLILFICCDVLYSRVVGNTMASLLATLPNSNRCMSLGDVVTTTSVKTRYYPVAKCRFHTIRIDVRTDISQPVRFEGGKVFVEFHFRKVISTCSCSHVRIISLW